MHVLEEHATRAVLVGFWGHLHLELFRRLRLMSSLCKALSLQVFLKLHLIGCTEEVGLLDVS